MPLCHDNGCPDTRKYAFRVWYRCLSSKSFEYVHAYKLRMKGVRKRRQIQQWHAVSINKRPHANQYTCLNICLSDHISTYQLSYACFCVCKHPRIHPSFIHCLQWLPSISVDVPIYLKNGVFWVVTPCGSCKNRRFGGTWRLLHQDDKNRRTRNNARCN
jgi:hypothetical protein